MRRFKTVFSASLIVLLVVALFCPAADAAYNVKQKWVSFLAVAGETLATGDVVCLKDADGYAYEADANDAALRPAVGIIGKGGASGAYVEVITSGILTGWTALAEGGYGYLSETAGAVTQAAPAWSQNVGIAINTTSYLFAFGSYFDSSALTAVGVLTGASPLIFEGATADAFENTFTFTDPTADRTVTWPDASGVPLLAAAIPQAATAVWGAANGLVAEGATADDFETTITVADPTADRTATFPDAGGTVMLSSLATNAPDAANSVTGASNALVYEGATADAFETAVTATDPTADRTVTFADASGTVMLSSLATNAADAANAVTGTSNGILFEGGTADAFETILTLSDPTADRTITLPDYSGGIPLVIVQSTVQTSQGDASTADVTGSDLSIAAGWLTPGKTIKWTIEGVITNANAGNKQVKLYLSDAAVLTLTLAGATGGDYMAEIWLYEHTDAANQDVYGKMLVAGQPVIFDRAAATKDVSGAVTAKLQLTLADAADTITVESLRIETWTK